MLSFKSPYHQEGNIASFFWEMVAHSSILAGDFHGQRSLVGHSPWNHKESDMTE